MSEATAAAATAPRKGKKKLLMALLAIGCVGSGAAVPMVLDVGAVFGKTKDEGNKKHDAKTAIVPFGDVVVNLAEERMNRYLRIKIAVLVDHEQEKKFEELLTKKKPAIKSAIITLLAGKTLKDVSGAVGVNRLQREILERIEDVLGEEAHDAIRGVVFEEYIVQ